MSASWSGTASSMRSSRYPRGTARAPGRVPWSVSFFSRTSTISGRGDCRDSSAGVTSGTCARAAFKSSDFVFMTTFYPSSGLSVIHLLHIL